MAGFAGIVIATTGPVLAQSDKPSEIEEIARELSTYVFPKTGPYTPEAIVIGNARQIESWARSAHANSAAEAFAHWNADGEIPGACAVCHSGQGFRAFHGLDGSAPGPLQSPIPTGGVVDCETCHKPGLAEIDSVTLPSGVVHPTETALVPCLTCHTGRSSGANVAKVTANMAEDTVNPELSFVNPHYKVAGATWLGGYGGIGYHYPGKTYSGRFLHAKPVASCLSCHEPHALTVNEAICLTCHETGAAQDIRISRQSYDGSGDTAQGIAVDIRANSDLLMREMLDYASQVAKTGLIYDSGRYPYFFADANRDGVVDQTDGRPVTFKGWTPTLLRAAYNWKVVTSDPGIHVHNPHYALELIHDSIESLAKAQGKDFAAFGLMR
ncbi:cytochrome C [Pseudooceanicola sp.]|uniref:cytochrome C n=1 Tax=Pseudooceanicola sp. TaxID=1914328 RepID=UPI002614B112|nr:cytochrome C [Pseudooceanicola sp.]MDF1855947.1 cytochrome C [Pseudooceanicola sp.]